MVIPIPKASSKDHMDELVGSMGWRLSGSDISRLNAFLSGYRRRSISRLVKPAINSHPLITSLLTWLGEKHSRK